jgi:7-carboxy-7-deazaguanine synthase
MVPIDMTHSNGQVAGRATYTVHSLFATLQGEGANAGRAAVFCRFAGCNLWSGREQDRATAVCRFCDTDFVGGDRYATAAALADAIEHAWSGSQSHRFVVFTGGEPLLQLDAALLAAVRAKGFHIAVETNGTIPPPDGIDFVCVSPKAGAPLEITRGQEIKIVFPQPGLDIDALAALDFTHRWLSPMDGPDLAANTQAAAAYCLAHPPWRLNIQAHKVWGIA